MRRPRVGGLPPVDSHSEIADLWQLLEDVIVFPFQEVIEPSVGQRVIIEASVTHAALPDYCVFRRSPVSAVQRRSYHSILLIADLGPGGLAHMVICSQVWPD